MVQTNRIYLKMKYFDQCNACLLIKSINFFEKKKTLKLQGMNFVAFYERSTKYWCHVIDIGQNCIFNYAH